jgi:hypothetical protein
MDASVKRGGQSTKVITATATSFWLLAASRSTPNLILRLLFHSLFIASVSINFFSAVLCALCELSGELLDLGSFVFLRGWLRLQLSWNADVFVP